MNCPVREVYTVHVNSENVTSPYSQGNFVAYIDIPLRNVVKAELIMASVAPSANTAAVVHVYIPELVSKFNQRAGVATAIGVSGINSTIGVSTGSQSNVGLINNSFATLPLDSASYLNAGVGRLIYNKMTNFPTDATYIEPIRQLSQLTIQLYNPNGNPTSCGGNSFFTFRFECAKDNVCLY